MIVTGNQIGAAMQLLGIYSKDVCREVDISNLTMTRVLKGEVKYSTSNKVVKFLESRGIEFIEHQGIRIQPKSTIVQLEGKEGFLEFTKDVVTTIGEQGGEICVSGVDERLWRDALEDNLVPYLFDMSKIIKDKNIRSRIIIEEGDNYYLATEYASYKHAPKDIFVAVPFYIYGDKMAMILNRGGDDITVNIVNSAKIAAAQRSQFNIVWNSLG